MELAWPWRQKRVDPVIIAKVQQRYGTVHSRVDALCAFGECGSNTLKLHPIIDGVEVMVRDIVLLLRYYRIAA